MTEKFDLFVIGGGSGGVRAARYASSLGLKTGLAEGVSLGGTCVNRGCIPKKLYSISSHFSEELRLMESFGWEIKTKNFSWKRLVENKKKEIKRLNEIYLDLLKNSKVKIFNDNAEFIDKKKIKVGKNLIESKNILISVGTRPRRIASFRNNNVITSDEAFDLKDLPKRILILGGGYIAAEFASIFNGFGVDTTLSIRGDRILSDFDSEISFFLMDQMKSKGIKFITKDFPKKISFKDNVFNVNFKKRVLTYDNLMEATGRVPNIESLKVYRAGIKLDKNDFIIIDDYFRTSEKNIFAIGDIVNRIQLTPVAISEAMTFVDNLVNTKRKKFKYENIPTAVFSDPNFASVGLTEAEARDKFKKICVYRSKFKSLKYSMSNFNERVFIKLITNSSNDRILGLHYIGENAAEIVQGFSVAIVNGLTKSQLDKTIGIHPTSAEEVVTLKK